jgi:hypothetical protein
MPKPTGDPEANELHEEAVIIDEELEGLEYTRVLDDPPPPSDAETIDLSSDSEPVVLYSPTPPPTRPTRTKATPKRKATSPPVVRTVARKVDSNSRPTQMYGLLDAASAQLASILNPAADDQQVNRQRDDITIITLNDAIRDLRAELSQERERRFTLERQLRDEEMRRLVEVRVQQQLQQHFSLTRSTLPHNLAHCHSWELTHMLPITSLIQLALWVRHTQVGCQGHHLSEWMHQDLEVVSFLSHMCRVTL